MQKQIKISYNTLLLIGFTSGEWDAMQKANRGEEFPTLDELMLLSGGGEPYKWMCANFMPFVVGFKNWKRLERTQKLSQIATCSDEGFLLLILENSYDRWVDEAKWLAANKDKAKEDRAPKKWAAAKYTNAGKNTANGRCRPCQGWASEGYLRFNELYKLVKVDRKGRHAFEEELFDECKMRASGKVTKVVVDAEIFPAHDLLDEEDDEEVRPSQARTRYPTNMDREDDDGPFYQVPRT